MNRSRILVPCLLGTLLSLPAPAVADDWTTVLDLRGEWRFHTGDNPEWAAPGLDDRAWETIFVPSAWEDEGFPGYDGYAWYRKSFDLPPVKSKAAVYLHLGYVDDVSEVYLNGKLIGFSGSFPPDYQTAYDSYQQFIVPPGVLHTSGPNVLAVRVYDQQLSGGILRGKVGLFQHRRSLEPDITLPGVWKFRTGDNLEWAQVSTDENEWREVLVPSFWEAMGLRDYDGFGWYRVRFRVPEAYREKQLVLLLGRIDDIDETFLNGERIGRTGSMGSQRDAGAFQEEYKQLRAYTIPRELVRPGDNVLAVRVYDGFMHGGIYDGPIGIVTRERYRRWSDDSRKGWDFLFDFFR